MCVESMFLVSGISCSMCVESMFLVSSISCSMCVELMFLVSGISCSMCVQKPKIDNMMTEGDQPANVNGMLSFRNVHFAYPSRPDVKVSKRSIIILTLCPYSYTLYSRSFVQTSVGQPAFIFSEPPTRISCPFSTDIQLTNTPLNTS